MSYTKGPWTVEPNESGCYGEPSEVKYLIYAADFVLAAVITDIDSLRNEGPFNAVVMASAPELLESLKEMFTLARLKFGNLDPDANVLLAKAEAAIKKAEGAA